MLVLVTMFKNLPVYFQVNQVVLFVTVCYLVCKHIPGLYSLYRYQEWHRVPLSGMPLMYTWFNPYPDHRYTVLRIATGVDRHKCASMLDSPLNS